MTYKCVFAQDGGTREKRCNPYGLLCPCQKAEKTPEPTRIESVTLADGKYTVTNDNGKLRAYRNGQPWDRDLVGDNLVYWMMVRILELESKIPE